MYVCVCVCEFVYTVYVLKLITGRHNSDQTHADSMHCFVHSRELFSYTPLIDIFVFIICPAHTFCI